MREPLCLANSLLSLKDAPRLRMAVLEVQNSQMQNPTVDKGLWLV